MLETRLLWRVIHYIWEVFRDPGAMKLRLRNYAGDELHVEESVEKQQIAIRYFAKQPTGELVKQVEIVCFIQHYGEWIPLELTKEGTTALYGTFDVATERVTITDSLGQAEAAGFCDAWALRLLEEGFLATAAQLNPLGTRSPHRPHWPEPTSDTPNLETIEDWVWDDGGCEATDGCWVAIDGVCPHGHPSWLLRLGLV